jgi:hypothetical protein
MTPTYDVRINAAPLQEPALRIAQFDTGRRAASEQRQHDQVSHRFGGFLGGGLGRSCFDTGSVGEQMSVTSTPC